MLCIYWTVSKLWILIECAGNPRRKIFWTSMTSHGKSKKKKERIILTFFSSAWWSSSFYQIFPFFCKLNVIFTSEQNGLSCQKTVTSTIILQMHLTEFIHHHLYISSVKYSVFLIVLLQSSSALAFQNSLYIFCIPVLSSISVALKILIFLALTAERDWDATVGQFGVNI